MMKRKARWLPCILAVVIALGSCAVMAEDTPDTAAGQQSVEKYMEAAQTLAGIGILTQKEVDGLTAEGITRGETALLLCRLLGISDYTKNAGGMRFLDVKEPEMAGAVRMLCDLNIISEPADGLFRPQDSLTYQEAVKIMVCLLGYGVKAEVNGGYPVGHLTVASDLKILGKVSRETDGAIAKGGLYQMMFNALDVELMTGLASGNGSYQYITTEGDTLLRKHMDLQMTQGVVSANQFTSLGGGAGVNDGEIEVGVTVFRQGNVNYNHLLGYQVKCYTRMENEEQTVVYMQPYRAATVEISADDITAFSVAQIRYIDTAGKQRTETLAADCAFIYNGRTAIALTEKDLKLRNGKVTLLDNGNDGSYDTVFIEDFVTYQIRGVDQNAQNIYLKGFGLTDTVANDTIPFNSQNKNPSVNVISGGKASEIGKLSANTTVSVMRSLDGNLTTLEIVNNTLKAKKVEAVEDDGDVIVIDGTRYDVARGEDGQRAASLRVGQVATFYLDRDGKIAGVSDDTEEGIYGYLVRAASVSMGKVQFKILPAGGKLTVYDGAPTVSLNGTKVSGETLATNPALWDSEKGETKGQLILFRVNGDGEVREIKTAGQAETDSLRLSKAYSSVQYDRDYIGGDYLVTSDVQVFKIPTDITDDEGFQAGGKSLLTNRSTYKMEVYDADAAKRIPRVVIHSNGGSGSKVSQSANLALLKKIVPSVGADNEVRYKVVFQVNGNEAVAYTGEEMETDRSNVQAGANFPTSHMNVTYAGGKLYFTKTKGQVDGDSIELKVGDFVEYNTNNKQELSYIKPIYISALEPDGQLHMYGGSDTARVIRCCYMTLDKVVDGIGFFSGGPIDGKPVPLSQANIYSVSGTGSKMDVLKRSVVELQPGTKMLVRTNYEKAMEIYFFE